MFKKQLTGLIAGAILSGQAIAGTYHLVTTPQVTGDEESRPAPLVTDFNLNDRVVALVTMKNFKKNDIPQKMSARWYRCDKMLVERDLSVNEWSARAADGREHHTWFWLNSAKTGAGQYRVEIVADGSVVARAPFGVNNASGQKGTCNNKYVLGENALFAFNGGTISHIDTLSQTDTVKGLIEYLRGFQTINSVTITGYTDEIGSEQHNQALSEQRAYSVRDIIVRSGVTPARMVVRGAGEANPVAICPGVGASPARIECLHPNRRVEIQVDGTQR